MILSHDTVMLTCDLLRYAKRVSDDTLYDLACQLQKALYDDGVELAYQLDFEEDEHYDERD